jgi:hypothetical protein
VQPVQPFVPQPQVPQPPYKPPFVFPGWLFPALILPLILLQQRKAEQQAREAQRLREDEEESKTPHDQGESMDNWEYKIVRNEMNLFEQPELLEEALQEEGQAGWQLVEQFDGNRMRLRRDVHARASDAELPSGYNPYRTMVLLEHARQTKARNAARLENCCLDTQCGHSYSGLHRHRHVGISAKPLADHRDFGCGRRRKAEPPP